MVSHPVRLVIASVAACMLGCFQYLYMLVTCNAAAAPVRQFLNETLQARYNLYLDTPQLDIWFGFYSSLQSLGGLCGAFGMAPIANYLGRRKSLILLAVLDLLIISPAFFARMLNSFEILAVVKFLGGALAAAGLSLQSPFITEISPAHLRGRLSSTAGVTNGLTAIMASALALPLLLGNELLWPYLFAVQSGVTLSALLVIIIFCEETPSFLLRTNRLVEAERSLRLYHGPGADFETFKKLQREEPTENEGISGAESSNILHSSNRPFLSHSFVIGVAAPLSGMDVVSAISTVVLIKAGLHTQQISIFVFGNGLASLAAAMIPLFCLDSAGRRVVFLCSAAPVVVLNLCHTSFLLALRFTGNNIFSYLLMGSLFLQTVMFVSGYGVLSYFHSTELCPGSLRSAAQSVATGACLGGAFLVTSTFMLFNYWLGDWIFLFFAVCMSVICVYYYRLIPEAKNRETSEVLNEVRSRWYGQQYLKPDIGSHSPLLTRRAMSKPYESTERNE